MSILSVSIYVYSLLSISCKGFLVNKVFIHKKKLFSAVFEMDEKEEMK